MAPDERGLKRTLCADLVLLSPPDAIVASVAASSSIAEVAAGSPRPRRLVCVYWSTKPDGLVEVVEHDTTEPGVGENVVALLTAAGRAAFCLGGEMTGELGDPQ